MYGGKVDLGIRYKLFCLFIFSSCFSQSFRPRKKANINNATTKEQSSYLIGLLKSVNDKLICQLTVMKRRRVLQSAVLLHRHDARQSAVCVASKA